MCSHPSLVSFFQIGELSLSLGVLEPCYTLEIKLSPTLNSSRKVIKDWGGGGGGVNLLD